MAVLDDKACSDGLYVGARFMSVCLKCGSPTEKTFTTGMGMYGKCTRCFFRWTEQDEKRLMGYAIEDRVDDKGVKRFKWVDVPDGCLFTF